MDSANQELRRLCARGWLQSDEIEELARHLDEIPPDRILESDGETPYISKDLNMGVHRDQPLPTATTGDEEQSSKRMEHFDRDVQEAAFKFVKLDHRIELHLKHPRPWVSVGGIRRRFYHYQLYGAFWMLLQERGPRRGVIEADRMGLGKTTIAFLYILLNVLLCSNAQHIQDHPDQHCQPWRPGLAQPLDAICPSASRWPIVCACEEHSVTRRWGLTPRFGATLLLLPRSLLGRWDAEWQELGVDEDIVRRPYIQHGQYPDRAMLQDQIETLKLEPATTGDRHAWTVGRKPAHRLIVMTTVESYYRQVQERCRCRRRRPDVDKYAWEDSDFTDGLGWARLVRDEAHLTPNWSTTIYRVIEGLAHNGWVPPNLVLLTATPMLRNGLSDIIASIRSINLVSPQIKQHEQCGEFAEVAYLEELDERYASFRRFQILQPQEAKGSPDEVELSDITGRLLTAYCISRNHDTVQNGKRLAHVPPLECRDVSCPSTDPNRQHYMQEVEHFLKKSAVKELKQQAEEQSHVVFDTQRFLNRAKHARMLATVPELVRLPKLTWLTWQFIASRAWHKRPRDSPYWKLALRAQGGGKLSHLLQLIGELGQDVTGEPEKLVVVTEFPAICLLVLCLLLSHDISADWMHADLDATQREAMCAAFQGLKEMDPTLGLGQPFRVLIGTSWILGQGLTLNKANRLVLMEPGRHTAVEAQIADRVHRIGSRTDRCWFYRLINPDSIVEGLLVNDHESQARFYSLLDAK